MQIQNFSHNNQNSDQGQGSDQDKSRQKNTLQRDIIMVESDFKKYNSEKILLDSEIRELKKEDARIKVALQEKQTRLGKVTFDLTRLETELKSLKKKLNLIN